MCELCSEHVCMVQYSDMTLHTHACMNFCMYVHFYTHVHMLLVSDITVSSVKTGDLVFHASVTAEVPISSLAEPELTDSHALASAECPLLWFLSVVVGMGHVLVFLGWDMACCMLAALPGAARL